VNKRKLQLLKDLVNATQVLLAQVEGLKDADTIKDEIGEIRDEERDLLDAMSERQVDSEKGQQQADAVEKLDDAFDKLEAVATKTTEIKDELQEAIDALEAIE
jgi:hypothetical protein